MKKKKYISPTIPSNFIPCDWNEGDSFKTIFSFDADRYVRNDVEQIAIEKTREILGLGSSDEIKLTSGSDNAILLTLSFASSHGYKKFRMRVNDYAQVKAFAGATMLDQEIVPNEKIFDEIAPGSIVYFSNPCNPSCEIISNEKIAEVCRLNPESLFLLDNAYIEFHPELQQKKLNLEKNLLIFRTFSKYWGFSGARLGAIIFSQKNDLNDTLAIINSKHLSAMHIQVIDSIYSNKERIINQRANEDKELTNIAEALSKKFNINYEKAGNYIRFDCNSDTVKNDLLSFFNNKKIAIRDLGHLEGYKKSLRFSFRKKAKDILELS